VNITTRDSMFNQLFKHRDIASTSVYNFASVTRPSPVLPPATPNLLAGLSSLNMINVLNLDYLFDAAYGKDPSELVRHFYFTTITKEAEILGYKTNEYV